MTRGNSKNKNDDREHPSMCFFYTIKSLVLYFVIMRQTMNCVMSREKWKIQTYIVEQVKFILNPGEAQTNKKKKKWDSLLIYAFWLYCSYLKHKVSFFKTFFILNFLFFLFLKKADVNDSNGSANFSFFFYFIIFILFVLNKLYEEIWKKELGGDET